MSAEVLILIVADLVAAIILTFGLYWRRHYRRDLVVAFFGINVGVLAVSAALADSQVGAGVGLGLFGVLSIIRLRSDELAQHEIAYYFAMLALGLLGGLEAAPAPLSLLFMALVVAAIAVVDHPALLRGHQRQQIVIDREEKVVKNRLHLDFRPDDQDAEVARLLALGARRVDVGQTGDEPWVVLADPEGNEFCILSS